jgi:hypothetical protein
MNQDIFNDPIINGLVQEKKKMSWTIKLSENVGRLFFGSFWSFSHVLRIVAVAGLIHAFCRYLWVYYYLR